MSQYIHFTEEQKEQAASVDLESFLLHRGEKLIASGHEKRLASDHSITVRGNEWYDHAVCQGGHAIIALSSVTAKGVSKICPILAPGAGVVTPRHDVHYVVTENGVADLYGKTLQKRAKALINIAHPDHQEELDKAAFERFGPHFHYVSK